MNCRTQTLASSVRGPQDLETRGEGIEWCRTPYRRDWMVEEGRARVVMKIYSTRSLGGITVAMAIPLEIAKY